MTPRVASEKIVVLRKRRIAESVEKSLFFPISQARDSRETWCLITDDCILNYTDPEQERFGAFLFHLCSWISNSCSRFYRLRAQIRLATCVLFLIICAERIHSFLISIRCPFWHETASFFSVSLATHAKPLLDEKYTGAVRPSVLQIQCSVLLRINIWRRFQNHKTDLHVAARTLLSPVFTFHGVICSLMKL